MAACISFSPPHARAFYRPVIYFLSSRFDFGLIVNIDGKAA
jgi:hypothetical protein